MHALGSSNRPPDPPDGSGVPGPGPAEGPPPRGHGLPPGAPTGGASPVRPPGWPALAVFAVAFVLTALSNLLLVFAVALVQTRGQRAHLEAAIARFALSAPGLLAGAVTNAVVLSAVAFTAARLFGGGPVGAQLRLGATRARPVGLVAACAGLLGLSFACGAARELLQLRGTGGMDAVAEVLENPSAGTFAAAVVAIGVVPGFAEETFFRGFLQTRLAASWGPGPAIVVAAAAFGLIHIDPVQGMVAFTAGVFLGWVVERFGGIRPSVLAHVTNNVVFVGVAGFSSGAGGPPARQIAILCAGSALCVAAILVLRSSRALLR